MMDKAIVVLSGGLDSCVALAVALDMGYDVGLLHVNYGQRTQTRELKAFNDIGEYYGIERRLVVDINYLRQIGGSALIVAGDTGSTYVPFRNGNILSIAVSWGEVTRANRIFIGVTQVDVTYPDCTSVFYDRFNQLLAVGLLADNKIVVETPLINMDKSEIIAKGVEFNVPFGLTWSCYDNEEFACGVCDSCRLRLGGFDKLGLKDPLTYRA